MKRRLITLLIVISIFTVGCSKKPNTNDNKPEFFTTIYENTNEIKNDYDSYTYLLRKFKSKKNSINMKFKSFSGNESIVVLNTIDNGYLDININHNIDKDNGRFKLVLVDPFKNVETLFEIKNNKNINMNENIHIDLKDGKSRLKIVGDSANGNIELLFKTNSNIAIIDK